MEPKPFLSYLSNKVSSLFHDCDSDDDEPRAGDIAPGSLEAPSILPRPASGKDTVFAKIYAFLRKDDAERRKLAYEGKELELRRPTGMRHWGAADKWRLF